jgi:hypothetical protein
VIKWIILAQIIRIAVRGYGCGTVGGLVRGYGCGTVGGLVRGYGCGTVGGLVRGYGCGTVGGRRVDFIYIICTIRIYTNKSTSHHTSYTVGSLSNK